MSRSLRPRVAASLVLAASVLLTPRPLASAVPGASTRVIGGEVAPDGRFPFAASLQRIGATGAEAHFCGGSLVAESWVLTAAHCLRNVTPAQFRVVVGVARLSSRDGQVRRPTEILIAPRFDGDPTHGADVALVRLTAPVAGIRPLEPVRPSERARWEPGDMARVLGWGVTSEAGAVANDQLLSARVPVRSDASMAGADVYGPVFRASDMLGAGPVAGGRDACFGDSGGPLVVGRGATLRQIGIVSFGRGCGRPGLPGVYARLGEGPVRIFVDSVIPPG